jgi:hypothetical protein
MSRIALIDADEIAFKISTGYQRKYYTVLKDDKVLWRTKYKEEAIESIGNRDDLEIGEEIEVYEPTDYKQRIDDNISRILYRTNSTDIRLYLSGSNNFRYSIATLQPYKGNRTTDKPVHLGLIQSEFKSRGAESVNYLEADDLLSINGINQNTVICSSDKDLRTVPSLNYNIDKEVLKVISNEEANYNFFYQLLIGDSIDNIPSPYGLGDVKARAFLDTFEFNMDSYYTSFIPFYSSFLHAKKKDGTYKTSWFTGQTVDEILEEVGTLLWMKRTYDLDEKWSLNG